jgi:hypothetical protein
VDRPERQARYYWEIVADNLSKAGWSCGCVAAIDSNGRKTIFIADAHRDDGKRFVAPQAGEGPATARAQGRPPHASAWIATLRSVFGGAMSVSGISASNAPNSFGSN